MTDEATKKFMEDVSEREPEVAKKIFHGVEGAARSALRERDIRSAGKTFLLTGVKALAREGLEKVSAQTPFHHRADIVSIFSQMNDKYGEDWWDWEPETIRVTVDRDYGIEIDEDGENIIGALQMVLNSNQAHEHWHVFEKTGHAFNGNNVDFSILQPLELDEIAVTLDILNTLRPKQDFLSEIHGYIAVSAKSSGVVFLPEGLFGSEPQKKLDEMNNDMDLKKRVASLWAKGEEGASLEEQIQIRRLKEVQDYLDNGKERG